MSHITDNLTTIKATIPDNVRLVAVSKTKPNPLIEEAYHAGHRHFGENKVQDLVRKQAELPKDIIWHYIGHLQRNKVKQLASFIGMIEAVDSIALLETINREAEKNSRNISCLLQFHIAEEESKFGLSLTEATAILESERFAQLHHITVAGVMGMATYTTDKVQVREEFGTLKQIFNTIKERFFTENEQFKEISMGMSGDFPIAIEEGATIVRVGSKIFGARE